MREKILGFIAFIIIRLIGSTFRYSLHFNSKEDEDYFLRCHDDRSPNLNTNYLLGFFHQDELCIINYFRNRNISVLISISKDGQIMNNIATRLGYEPVRGSSSRRAVSGLIAAIKKVKAGYKVAFAVDGPRGPIYKVKDGLCAISRKTNIKVVPLRVIASNQIISEKSWNKAKFPKPFSRIEMHFGKIDFYEAIELEQELLRLPQ